MRRGMSLCRDAGVDGVTLSGLDFRFSRGIGVNVASSTAITIDSVSLYAIGSTGVNVTDGANVTVQVSSVRRWCLCSSRAVTFAQNSVLSGLGNGGVFVYAGDRATLTPSGHVIQNCSISDYNRYQWTYCPGVALGGVGTRVTGCEIFDAPHQAIFVSGNDHTVDGCYIHDVVQATSDSGAIYAGRDWTYQGNLIASNTFTNINTVFNAADNNVQVSNTGLFNSHVPTACCVLPHPASAPCVSPRLSISTIRCLGGRFRTMSSSMSAAPITWAEAAATHSSTTRF